MNIMKGIKITAGLITAAVGSIVAIKAGKTPKTTAEGDSTEQIDDEEILEMMEAEEAAESPEEEEPAEEPEEE